MAAGSVWVDTDVVVIVAVDNVRVDTDVDVTVTVGIICIDTAVVITPATATEESAIWRPKILCMNGVDALADTLSPTFSADGVCKTVEVNVEV